MDVKADLKCRCAHTTKCGQNFLNLWYMVDNTLKSHETFCVKQWLRLFCAFTYFDKRLPCILLKLEETRPVACSEILPDQTVQSGQVHATIPWRKMNTLPGEETTSFLPPLGVYSRRKEFVPLFLEGTWCTWKEKGNHKRCLPCKNGRKSYQLVIWKQANHLANRQIFSR